MNKTFDEPLLNLRLCLEHSGLDEAQKLQVLCLLAATFSKHEIDGEAEAIREARNAFGNAAARLVAAELGIFVKDDDPVQRRNPRGAA